MAENDTIERLSSPTDLKEVKLSELEGIIEEHKVGDAVIVSDADYQPFVLLEDIDGKKFWQHTYGKSVAETIRFNEWYKRGQAKFNENAVPKEFLEEMREVLLSISVLGNFFQWEPEEVGSVMDSAIVRLAFKLYVEEKKLTCSIEDLKEDEEFIPYIQMVTIYTKSFLEIVESVRASADQAKVEGANLPKD